MTLNQNDDRFWDYAVTAQVEQIQAIILYLLISIDTLVLALTLLLASHAVLFERDEWTVNQTLKCVLPWPLLLRLVPMTMHVSPRDNYLTRPLDSNGLAEVFLNQAPQYILLSAYSLLCIFFVGLFHRVKKDRSYWLAQWRILAAAFNAILYAVWLALFVALAATSGRTRQALSDAQIVYNGVMGLIIALAFIVSAFLLRSRLARLVAEVAPIRAARTQITRISTRLVVAVAVCSAVILLRALLVVVSTVALPSGGGIAALVINAINLSVCDSLPIATIALTITMPESLRRKFAAALRCFGLCDASNRRHRYDVYGNDDNDDIESAKQGKMRRKREKGKNNKNKIDHDDESKPLQGPDSTRRLVRGGKPAINNHIDPHADIGALYSTKRILLHSGSDDDVHSMPYLGSDVPPLLLRGGQAFSDDDDEHISSSDESSDSLYY
jgi:hypothetical protein